MNLNQSLPRIDASRFSMNPRADVPRARFRTEHPYKATIGVDYLYPILSEEVLPGDAHHGRVQIVARLNDLLFPIMDNLTLETFFFFIPNRLVWTNWVKMMGERANPSDSISYTTPQVDINGPPAICSIYDYFGLPCAGQWAAALTVNDLPFRGYYLVWNEWFRDQNLQNSLTINTGDGATHYGSWVLQKRNKKPDYLTSALPWPVKGGDITLPINGLAQIQGIATLSTTVPTNGNPASYRETGQVATVTGWPSYYSTNAAGIAIRGAVGGGIGTTPHIYADLSTATGQTINALRLAFQTQKLLERDARGGTRYTEIIQSHFGVTPQDTRLQRPEYIGGGRTLFSTQAIPQTSATGLTGGTRPLGSLGAQAIASDQHGFSYYAEEHGFILGLVNVSGEITYQQNIQRKWTRATRYDYYWPAFAHLGEQAIRNDEVYATGVDATDLATFGYQERWSEYRYRPGQVCGMFRSTHAGNIDEWHLAEQFGSQPALNTTFIQQTTPITRILAAGGAAANMAVLFDSIFTITSTRPMPMNSVPGMIDRF